MSEKLNDVDMNDTGKRWQHWIRMRFEQNYTLEETLDMLAEHQFSLDQIKALMGERFPKDLTSLGGVPEWQPPTFTPWVDYKQLSEIALTQSPEKERYRLNSPLLQLYMIDNFLTDAQCDALIELSKTKLEPSTVTYDPGDYFRTSKTCHLGYMEHPLVAEIDNKISRELGINRYYGETLQAQHYEVGEQFKLHLDFFEPRTEIYDRVASTRGNRTWTCMIYLNDVEEGGGTWFLELDMAFKPKKGRALAWNNLHATGRPNYHTRHAGLPVEKGNKTIITKWFREIADVPMFGDL